MSCGMLEFPCCQIRKEAFFLKQTEKKSKTNKLKWREYNLPILSSEKITAMMYLRIQL